MGSCQLHASSSLLKMMFIVQSAFDEISPFDDGTVDDPFVVPQDERAFPTAPVAMLMIEVEVEVI